jgi:hypothetical protein
MSVSARLGEVAQDVAIVETTNLQLQDKVKRLEVEIERLLRRPGKQALLIKRDGSTQICAPYADERGGPLRRMKRAIMRSGPAVWGGTLTDPAHFIEDYVLRFECEKYYVYEEI